MFSLGSIRLIAALNVLATLIGALVPVSATGECLCAPGGCGSARSPASSCCAATERQSPHGKHCCDASTSHVVPASCCCTQVLPKPCLMGEQHASGCECSPAWPANPAAKIESSLSRSEQESAAQPPLWAVTPLCFNLNVVSPLATDMHLHATPIPLRELYCVWRI